MFAFLTGICLINIINSHVTFDIFTLCRVKNKNDVACCIKCIEIYIQKRDRKTHTFHINELVEDIQILQDGKVCFPRLS